MLQMYVNKFCHYIFSIDSKQFFNILVHHHQRMMGTYHGLNYNIFILQTRQTKSADNQKYNHNGEDKQKGSWLF